MVRKLCVVAAIAVLAPTAALAATGKHPVPHKRNASKHVAAAPAAAPTAAPVPAAVAPEPEHPAVEPGDDDGPTVVAPGPSAQQDDHPANEQDEHGGRADDGGRHGGRGHG